MEVNPHTSLKHRLLGTYFKICRQVMKKRRLYYVDLYTGDGEGECNDAPLPKWDCPFITGLLKDAKIQKLKLTCFLNDLDPENKGIYEKLKQKVSLYGNFVKSITKEDANKVFKKIIRQIPSNEWSIFFLDPSRHSELDWKTIQEISRHEKYDYSSRRTRKPELIINLMTSSMQRSVKSNPGSITRALGTDEWKSKIGREEKMHSVFLEIFTDKLKKLGYETSSICITQTLPNNSVLYYIVFASNIPGAIKIIEKKYAPYIGKIMKEKWGKENYKCRMVTKAKSKGYKTLDEFSE